MSLIGISLGVAFELATHVFVHYTVEGAAFGAGLAGMLSPAMAAMGLTYTFSEAAAETALANLAPDDPIMSLPGIAPT
ncbi:MAG: hypothetical protein ACRBCT_03310 [Alphaproteobacteria bacterium]